MHSRAIDRRSASKCQGKWPDQTLDQAFGLSEVLVAVSTSRLSLQEGQENANIDAGLGFIWRISVKANMHMMMKSFFVATALIAAASSAQAQSYNWNSRRIVVDPPTAAQRAAADEEARREEKARDAVGNTSGASTTASATTQASGGGINGSYSTTFPLTENPISEGGSWTNGGATGLGWANVQTTPGLSFGTGPVNAGTYLYADPTAVLKGVWAQDQQVQATVKVRGAYGRACCKEVELLIRMTITRNSITGYELNCSVVRTAPYLALVRWNGPLNNFTYLVRNTITCVNGDVLKLTAVGNTFTVYKNGGQVLQGTDATFQKGSPGVGFYNSVDNNWSGFGLSNFSASNVGSSDTTPPRIQDHD